MAIFLHYIYINNNKFLLDGHFSVCQLAIHLVSLAYFSFLSCLLLLLYTVLDPPAKINKTPSPVHIFQPQFIYGKMLALKVVVQMLAKNPVSDASKQEKSGIIRGVKYTQVICIIRTGSSENRLSITQLRMHINIDRTFGLKSPSLNIALNHMPQIESNLNGQNDLLF